MAGNETNTDQDYNPSADSDLESDMASIEGQDDTDHLDDDNPDDDKIAGDQDEPSDFDDDASFFSHVTGEELPEGVENLADYISMTLPLLKKGDSTNTPSANDPGAIGKAIVAELVSQGVIKTAGPQNKSAFADIPSAAKMLEGFVENDELSPDEAAKLRPLVKILDAFGVPMKQNQELISALALQAHTGSGDSKEIIKYLRNNEWNDFNKGDIRGMFTRPQLDKIINAGKADSYEEAAYFAARTQPQKIKALVKRMEAQGADKVRRSNTASRYGRGSGGGSATDVIGLSKQYMSPDGSVNTAKLDADVRAKKITFKTRQKILAYHIKNMEGAGAR